MTCPSCGQETPAGRHCVRCGASLEGGGTGRGFAAAPHERVWLPRLVSSLFPQLPRSSARGFHAALIAGLGLVAGLAALRLVPIALVGAALLVPLLTVVYCYVVDVYESVPLLAVAFTIAWGAAFGAGMGLAARAVASSGVDLLDRTSTAHLVTGGVLLPLLAFVLMLAGPLVLLPYRRYNDVLDGAIFGAVTAATFAASQVIVYGVHMFDRGVRPAGEAGPWVIRVLAIAVAQPVLAMAAVGFAAAALWLRFRAAPAERMALGRLGNPVAAVPLAAALVVGGAVAEPLVAGGTWLACLAALAAAALLLLRRAIHVGLREEAAEIPIGAPITCADCRAITPRHTFCANCGVALRALPKARDAGARGTSEGRTSRLAAVLVFGAALASALGAAAALAAIVAAPAPRPLCRPYQPCGRPPIAGAPLVNGVVWRSPDLGFAVEYDADHWHADAQTGDSLTLTTDPDTTLALRGSRGSPRDVLHDQLSSLSSTFLGFTRDPAPENQLLGTNIGLRPGPGGAYIGTLRSPQGSAVQDSMAVMAASDGSVSIVATVVTGAASPDEKARVFGLADQVLKSVAWRSDLRGGGARTLFRGRPG